MAIYPRPLVDNTATPYHSVVGRIVAAIDYDAKYEDRNLDIAAEQITAMWLDWQAKHPGQSLDADTEVEQELLDWIENVLDEHGFVMYVAEDYPGLWLINEMALDGAES